MRVILPACFTVTTWFQYNNTYFTTYEESGKRRLSLAERLRKLPLSFFGKRDLADLTSTIMSDCEVIEKSTSHFIPGLFGSLISTILIAAGLFVFDWRMALAALWVIPVSVLIVILSYNKLTEENKELKKENEANWRQLTQIMRSNPEVFEQFSGDNEIEQELIDNGYVVK